MPALPEQVDEVDSYTPVMHLKYYSKEIPKAKTLPISRVVCHTQYYMLTNILFIPISFWSSSKCFHLYFFYVAVGNKL